MAPTALPLTHHTAAHADAGALRWPGGVAAVVGGVVAGAAAGMVVSGLMFGSQSGLVTPAVQAAAVWLLGASFGLGVLLALSAGRAERLGPAVLAASVVRMLAALGLGVTAYFALSPESRVFWIAFLGAGAGALIAETAWAMRAIQRAHRAHSSSTTLTTPAGGGAC